MGSGWLYRLAMTDLYRLARPLLFALPPEVAHALTLAGLSGAHRLGLLSNIPAAQPSAPIVLMGLQFHNRLGVAAGLDKNGACIDSLGALGFGFVEVGTVTPQPQEGNARPRLFRLVSERALINRMGFPNRGVQALCVRLRARTYRGVCGVNIGKNASTPLDDAWHDYVDCLTAVYPYADYVAVNISSPNTAELRRLQHGELLRELLAKLLDARVDLARSHDRHVPLLVKLTADLDETELASAARISMACGIDGLIATNTTVQRDGFQCVARMEEGGLSGALLLQRAVRAVQCLRAEVGAGFPLIGVGGIESADDAVAMRAAGADLVQVYTGLVYRGPALVREILQERLTLTASEF